MWGVHGLLASSATPMNVCNLFIWTTSADIEWVHRQQIRSRTFTSKTAFCVQIKVQNDAMESTKMSSEGPFTSIKIFDRNTAQGNSKDNHELAINQFFLRKSFGTRYGPVGTRFFLWFSLILRTRFSILGTQIGSLKHLEKPCINDGEPLFPVNSFASETKYFLFYEIIQEAFKVPRGRFDLFGRKLRKKE